MEGIAAQPGAPPALQDDRLTETFRWLLAQPDGTPPSRSLALISTPRSGSKMLCLALEGTGALGRPREWLNPRYVKAWADLKGVSRVELPQYLHEIVRKSTSANGIFSINLHVGQILLWRSKGFDPMQMGFDLCVGVHRRDRLQQAVSLAKARYTDQWSAGTAPRRAVPDEGLPFERVLTAFHDLEKHAQYCERELAARLRMNVFYEDFSTDLEVVRPLLDHFGLGDVGLAVPPHKRIQRDAVDGRALAQLREHLARQGAIGGAGQS